MAKSIVTIVNKINTNSTRDKEYQLSDVLVTQTKNNLYFLQEVLNNSKQFVYFAVLDFKEKLAQRETSCRSNFFRLKSSAAQTDRQTKMIILIDSYFSMLFKTHQHQQYKVSQLMH